MFTNKNQIESSNCLSIKAYISLSKSNFISLTFVFSVTAIFIISCEEQPIQTYKPSQKGIEKLKEDVIEKGKIIDVNTLVNLCFTDFAFDQENKETVLLVYNTIEPEKFEE